MVATLYGDAAQPTVKAWDPAILQDMRHPHFAEHKSRFEAWQDARADEDRW
jgi:hypothetical protein